MNEIMNYDANYINRKMTVAEAEMSLQEMNACLEKRTANFVVAAAERYASKFLDFEELNSQSSNVVEYASLITDKLASLLEDESYDQNELMIVISNITDMIEYVNEIQFR